MTLAGWEVLWVSTGWKELWVVVLAKLELVIWYRSVPLNFNQIVVYEVDKSHIKPCIFLHGLISNYS